MSLTSSRIKQETQMGKLENYNLILARLLEIHFGLSNSSLHLIFVFLMHYIEIRENLIRISFN
jgi:hypothetical protein